MPFKIVQTIEKGRHVLTAVPHNWENNQILFWPRKHEKLRRIEDSIPDTTWQRLNCILKRSNLPTFKVAELEIDAMSNFSDTGTDNENSNKKSSKVHVEQHDNFNEMAKAIMENELQTVKDKLIKEQRMESQHSLISRNEDISFANNNDTTIPITQMHTELENINQESQLVLVENVIMTPSSSSLRNTNNMSNDIPLTEQPPSGLSTAQSNVSDVNAALTIISEKLDALTEKVKRLTDNQLTIAQNQQSIFTNQGNILTTMLEIQTQFDEFIKKNSTTQLDVKPDLKPISNLKELQEFEKLIMDPDFEAKLRRTIEVLCGKGKNRGVNNAYTLIDVLFTRNFLCQCSWTGASRTEEQKNCLKGFTKTCDFFFSIIQESDSEFKKPDFVKFMKTVLKNSLQRSQSKRVRISSSRNRQKVAREATNANGSITKKISINPTADSSKEQSVNENISELETNSPGSSLYNYSSGDSTPRQLQTVKIVTKASHPATFIPKKLLHKSRATPLEELPDCENICQQVNNSTAGSTYHYLSGNSTPKQREKVKVETKASHPIALFRKKLPNKSRAEPLKQLFDYDNIPQKGNNLPAKRPYNDSSNESSPRTRQKVKLVTKATRDVACNPNKYRPEPLKELSLHENNLKESGDSSDNESTTKYLRQVEIETPFTHCGESLSISLPDKLETGPLQKLPIGGKNPENEYDSSDKDYLL